MGPRESLREGHLTPPPTSGRRNTAPPPPATTVWRLPSDNPLLILKTVSRQHARLVPYRGMSRVTEQDRLRALRARQREGLGKVGHRAISRVTDPDRPASFRSFAPSVFISCVVKLKPLLISATSGSARRRLRIGQRHALLYTANSPGQSMEEGGSPRKSIVLGGFW